jgi:hypothetical protein
MVYVLLGAVTVLQMLGACSSDMPQPAAVWFSETLESTLPSNTSRRLS